MFIGIVSINKDFVEKVIVDAENVDEASHILAEYVFTTYNREEVPQDGYYYNGVLIDTTNLKTITKNKNDNIT